MSAATILTSAGGAIVRHAVRDCPRREVDQVCPTDGGQRRSRARTFDGKPLKYHWVVLRGDEDRIRINEAQRRRFHRGTVGALPRATTGRSRIKLESDRVDIGVFVTTAIIIPRLHSSASTIWPMRSGPTTTSSGSRWSITPTLSSRTTTSTRCSTSARSGATSTNILATESYLAGRELAVTSSKSSPLTANWYRDGCRREGSQNGAGPLRRQTRPAGSCGDTRTGNGRHQLTSPIPGGVARRGIGPVARCGFWRTDVALRLGSRDRSRSWHLAKGSASHGRWWKAYYLLGTSRSPAAY